MKEASLIYLQVGQSTSMLKVSFFFKSDHPHKVLICKTTEITEAKGKCQYVCMGILYSIVPSESGKTGFIVLNWRFLAVST